MFTVEKKEMVILNMLAKEQRSKSISLGSARWKPTDTIDTLLSCIQENQCPLVCSGYFGRNFYTKAPIDAKDTFVGYQIYGWSPGTRKAEISDEKARRIELIGVRKNIEANTPRGWIYYRDSEEAHKEGNPIILYKISYEQFVNNYLSAEVSAKAKDSTANNNSVALIPTANPTNIPSRFEYEIKNPKNIWKKITVHDMIITFYYRVLRGRTQQDKDQAIFDVIPTSYQTCLIHDENKEHPGLHKRDPKEKLSQFDMMQITEREGKEAFEHVYLHHHIKMEKSITIELLEQIIQNFRKTESLCARVGDYSPGTYTFLHTEEEKSLKSNFLAHKATQTLQNFSISDSNNNAEQSGNTLIVNRVEQTDPTNNNASVRKAENTSTATTSIISSMDNNNF